MTSSAQLLIGSDTLLIDNVSFNLSGPSQINPGPQTTGPICVTKSVATLDFSLSTKTDLKINLPIDIICHFAGAIKGQTPSGDTIVEWTIDQVVDKSFNSSGIKIDVDRITGSLLALCRPLIPREQGQSCVGLSRSLGVFVESVPGNELVVNASVVGVGINVTAAEVTLTARGGDQFSFSPEIKTSRDECGIGASAGENQTFWVIIPNVGIQQIIYQWAVSGAVIIGLADGQSVQLQIGSSVVNLSVTVTIAGVAQTVNLKYSPETNQSIKVKSLRCRLYRYLKRNIYFDPLWDPLRGDVLKPHSLPELKVMAKTVDELSKILNESIMISSRRQK